MIIVTLFTLKGMARRSIQRIKALLLYIVYGIFFVDTVDMKIKAHNALNAMFVETVETVDTKHIHTFSPITFLIFKIFNKKFGKLRLRAFQPLDTLQDKDLIHSMLSMSNCQYKTYPHIPAHNNIQLIFTAKSFE